MKFLQFNITSINTATEELWHYQNSHSYDAIFLQETNYTEGKTLGNFKHWKTKTYTKNKNKTMGFGVGTFVSNCIKNVFRDDINTDLELIWNEMQIKGKTVLIGNIYISPHNVDQLHKLDIELEKRKGENIILLGDFNSRNKTWDKNVGRNTKMRNILENIINCHNLHIETEVDFTYQHSEKSSQTGKSTIDLTLSRGVENIKINTIELDLIKSRHRGIEITIAEEDLSSSKPHFATKNANWKEWERTISENLKNYIQQFPNKVSKTIIDNQTEILTDVIVESATKFFGMTKTSKKTSKGWWNRDITIAKRKTKRAYIHYKKRQTPGNQQIYLQEKEKYQNLIKTSKLENQKRNTKFLNESKDAAQFWHRYEKVLGKKKNNIVEPIYDHESNTYIFEDIQIAEKMHNYHILKTNLDNKYDENFKQQIEDKVKKIISSTTNEPSHVFMGEEHVKNAIKHFNKNSAPGPDKITIELIQNGGEVLITALSLLIRNSFLLGHFPKPWKQDNKIYLKKPDKDNYHEEKSYRPISLLNTLGKIYERIILQEAVNILEENNFFKGKNLYAYQKKLKCLPCTTPTYRKHG